MSNKGRYQEDLSQYRESGVTGTLVLEGSTWYIRYWIPGIRMTDKNFIRLPVDIIETYIDALERNYYEYERLKGVNEEYERLKGEMKRGAMQITGINSLLINVGGPYPGACIGRQGFVPPYVQVETEEQLQKLIESYRYASERAKEIQVIMFGSQK